LPEPEGVPLPGRSLLAHARGEVPPEARIGLCEANGGHSAALRCGRFKLVYDPRDPLQQLFDLQRDPGERHNLAAEPAMAGVLRRLQERLLRCWEPPSGRPVTRLP
jgi:choline-sulfatase